MPREKTPKKDRKVVAKKNYCSKFVANVLDKLIQIEIAGINKHQRTVKSEYYQQRWLTSLLFQASKWLSKMRSSLLKKISASTRVLFAPEGVVKISFISHSNTIFQRLALMMLIKE